MTSIYACAILQICDSCAICRLVAQCVDPQIALRDLQIARIHRLRLTDINTPAYCSENQSLFALTRTSFAASSSFSFTSTGLILIYSSLFPSLINCFCSMFSLCSPFPGFHYFKYFSAGYFVFFIPVRLSLACCSSSDSGRLYTTKFFFPLHIFHLFYPCIDFFGIT